MAVVGRGRRGALGSLLALGVLLVAGSRLAAAQCTFTGDDLVSDIYEDRAGFILASKAGAFKCLNQVKVNYTHAYESVMSLAKLFNSSYVFVAIAANPNYREALSTIIWRYGIDLPATLTKLASSWDPSASVPLGDLYFAVNHAFNSLYDAHVNLAGTGGNGGTFLGNAVANLTRLAPKLGAGDGRIHLVEGTTGEILLRVLVSRSSSTNYTVRAAFATSSGTEVIRTFSKIQNGSPWDWFVGVSLNPALGITFKPPGTRVNKLLARIRSQAFFAEALGNITLLPEPPVVYADGTTSSLRWGLSFPPTVSEERLRLAERRANTPGTPYRALQKAQQVLDNATVTPTKSSVPHSPPLPTYVSRRQLQESATLPASITPIFDAENETLGFYYFNGSKAVLKLTSFLFDVSVLRDWWPAFLQAAADKGAKELIIDLINNGGGAISSGLGMLLSLYPEQKYSDFNLRFDRIIGDDATYAYANGLTPEQVNASIQAVLADPAAALARAAALLGNKAELQRLVRKTKTVVSALNVLLASASTDQEQECLVPGEAVQQDNCTVIWSSISKQLLSLVDKIGNGSVGEAQLKELAGSTLPGAIRSFWPYGGAIEDDGTDPYAEPQAYYRGGKYRNYTQKFDVQAIPGNWTYKNFLPSLSLTKPPFSKILALSDGGCGSTCDIFGRSSWFWSRRTPEAPVFRFLTFGGTGRFEDSSATSFPGGNVAGNNWQASAHAYAILANLTADWLGSAALGKAVAGWVDLLPDFPSFLDHYTPSYTVSEIYQQGALKDYLPAEYLKIPTDIYLPVWYQATGIPAGPDAPTDLPDLYAKASAAIDSMPSPRAPRG